MFGALLLSLRCKSILNAIASYLQARWFLVVLETVESTEWTLSDSGSVMLGLILMSFRTQMSRDDGGCTKLSVNPIGMEGNVVSLYVKKDIGLVKLKEAYSEMEGVEVHTLRAIASTMRTLLRALGLGNMAQLKFIPKLGAPPRHSGFPGTRVKSPSLKALATTPPTPTTTSRAKKLLFKCKARLVI